MSRDRNLSLDRLQRHTADAIDRLNDKLEHHRAAGTKEANGHIVRLRARMAKLQRNYELEAARIETHIRNIEQPHIRRPKRQKPQFR